MSAILFVVGILITGAGVIAIGFGIPINETAVGQTFIIAGATGLVGGPALVGLAVTVARLTAIAAALKIKPVAETARAADVTQPAAERTADAPPPAVPATIDVSAVAMERLRSSLTRPVVANAEEVPLSPNGGQQPVESMPGPTARSGAAVAALKEPRLDFLFRARTARSPQPESFDVAWQKRATNEAPQPAADNVTRLPVPAPPVEERQSPPALVPAEEPRSATILKSGVVDGMGYTLYADGSIEAQLPHGTVRFGSIADLRAHIENGS